MAPDAGGDSVLDEERDQIIESMEALELDENRLRQALTTTCPACDEEVPVGGMRLHLKADHLGSSPTP